MGHWQKTKAGWHDTSLIHCDLCGKIVPGDVWVAEVAKEMRNFCDTDCERLYVEYWLPKYGAAKSNSLLEQNALTNIRSV
jgi:hypothetical protein